MKSFRGPTLVLLFVVGTGLTSISAAAVTMPGSCVKPRCAGTVNPWLDEFEDLIKAAFDLYRAGNYDQALADLRESSGGKADRI